MGPDWYQLGGKILLTAALGLLLPGCGGCSTAPMPGSSVVVRAALVPGIKTAEAEWDCSGHVIVSIETERVTDGTAWTTAYHWPRLIVHELGHARGLVHTDQPGSVMSVTDPAHWPEPWEAREALAYGPPSRVTVADAELAEATAVAVAAWNDAAGGEMFTLAP